MYFSYVMAVRAHCVFEAPAQSQSGLEVPQVQCMHRCSALRFSAPSLPTGEHARH